MVIDNGRSRLLADPRFREMLCCVRCAACLNVCPVYGKIGGHAFGAFDGERMIGFCIAIPGLKPGGRCYLHSHMLGVLPEYRDHHIGRMLKLHQREDALAERAYAPWLDMEALMREHGIPLYTLESKQPLACFDLISKP